MEPAAGELGVRDRHALNNVLAKILGCAELALTICEQDEVRAELELIADLVERAAEFVVTAGHTADSAGEPAKTPWNG